MSTKELQDEEREVLSSIYDGDECFKQINTSTYQYKFGEDNSIKSFLVEIKWGDEYPNELPMINMDTFYNKHIVTPLKNKVIDILKTEAEQFIGMSMTYSLFEFLKEKFEELINEQPIEPEKFEIEKLCITDDDIQDTNKKEKKIQLTKAQKRRQWNRTDGKGEKPRGWNWVDIVKHLSQTGPKEETQPIS